MIVASMALVAQPLGRVGLALQPWLARKFVNAYERLRPLDPGRMRYGEAFRCFRTLLAIAVSRLAKDSRIAAEYLQFPHDNGASAALLAARMRELTGAVLTIPASV